MRGARFLAWSEFHRSSESVADSFSQMTCKIINIQNTANTTIFTVDLMSVLFIYSLCGEMLRWCQCESQKFERMRYNIGQVCSYTISRFVSRCAYVQLCKCQTSLYRIYIFSILLEGHRLPFSSDLPVYLRSVSMRPGNRLCAHL